MGESSVKLKKILLLHVWTSLLYLPAVLLAAVNIAPFFLEEPVCSLIPKCEVTLESAVLCLPLSLLALALLSRMAVVRQLALIICGVAALGSAAAITALLPRATEQLFIEVLFFKAVFLGYFLAGYLILRTSAVKEYFTREKNPD